MPLQIVRVAKRKVAAGSRTGKLLRVCLPVLGQRGAIAEGCSAPGHCARERLVARVQVHVILELVGRVEASAARDALVAFYVLVKQDLLL